MVNGSEIAGDVASSSGTLAGLILVYIGALATGFGAFEATERRSVAGSYQRRAWFAYVGFVLFLISVALAVLGKWLAVDGMAVGALALLIVGLAWVLVTATLTVMDIK